MYHFVITLYNLQVSIPPPLVLSTHTLQAASSIQTHITQSFTSPLVDTVFLLQCYSISFCHNFILFTSFILLTLHLFIHTHLSLTLSRQQVVQRIDQDFDQRRVPTAVERYLSASAVSSNRSATWRRIQAARRAHTGHSTPKNKNKEEERKIILSERTAEDRFTQEYMCWEAERPERKKRMMDDSEEDDGEMRSLGTVNPDSILATQTSRVEEDETDEEEEDRGISTVDGTASGVKGRELRVQVCVLFVFSLILCYHLSSSLFFLYNLISSGYFLIFSCPLRFRHCFLIILFLFFSALSLHFVHFSILKLASTIFSFFPSFVLNFLLPSVHIFSFLPPNFSYFFKLPCTISSFFSFALNFSCLQITSVFHSSSPFSSYSSLMFIFPAVIFTSSPFLF